MIERKSAAFIEAIEKIVKPFDEKSVINAIGKVIKEKSGPTDSE